MGLTASASAVSFDGAGAKSSVGDRQALSSKRRASAIVIESGAFFVPAPSMTVWTWMLSSMPAFPFAPVLGGPRSCRRPLDRQASGDGFLKQKEATMPRLVLRSRLPFREARE